MVPGRSTGPIDEFAPTCVVVDQQAVAGARRRPPGRRCRGSRRPPPRPSSPTRSPRLPKVERVGARAARRPPARAGVPPDVRRRRPTSASPTDLVLAFTTERADRAGHPPGPRRTTSLRRPVDRPAARARRPFPWEWLDADRRRVLVSLGTVNAEVGDRFFAHRRRGAGATRPVQVVRGRPAGPASAGAARPCSIARLAVPAARAAPPPRRGRLPRRPQHRVRGARPRPAARGGADPRRPADRRRPGRRGPVPACGSGSAVSGPPSCADAVDRVLDDPTYRAAAERIATLVPARPAAPLPPPTGGPRIRRSSTSRPTAPSSTSAPRRRRRPPPRASLPRPAAPRRHLGAVPPCRLRLRSRPCPRWARTVEPSRPPTASPTSYVRPRPPARGRASVATSRQAAWRRRGARPTDREAVDAGPVRDRPRSSTCPATSTSSGPSSWCAWSTRRPTARTRCSTGADRQHATVVHRDVLATRPASSRAATLDPVAYLHGSPPSSSAYAARTSTTSPSPPAPGRARGPRDRRALLTASPPATPRPAGGRRRCPRRTTSPSAAVAGPRVGRSLALAAYLVQPALAFRRARPPGRPRPSRPGRPHSPPRAWRRRGWVRLVGTARADAAAGAPSATARGPRPAYDELLAPGIERFFEPRRDTCPLCESRTSLTLQVGHARPAPAQAGPLRASTSAATAATSSRTRGSASRASTSTTGTSTTASAASELERIFSCRGRRPYQGRVDMVAEPRPTPQRWLDVGTGHGHFCLVARERWPDTTFDGLDLSDVDRRGRPPRAGSTAATAGLFPDLADRPRRPLRRRVSMHHYLEHTRDPRAELDAAATVLAAGRPPADRGARPRVPLGPAARPLLAAVVPAPAPALRAGRQPRGRRSRSGASPSSTGTAPGPTSPSTCWPGRGCRSGRPSPATACRGSPAPPWPAGPGARRWSPPPSPSCW